MVLFNYSTKELTAKVVYYGAGLCGKTTNLQWIHEQLPIKNKGKMLSLATEADRTLFFDFLPIELGTIRGMKTRVQLYTVPGQVFYNATRRMVLKGADCVVFVADSQDAMIEANADAMKNLRENLVANELDPDTIPLVIQYNKRDLPNAASLDTLNKALNTRGVPFVEASAKSGKGVEETLKVATQLVFKVLAGKYGNDAAPRNSQAIPRPARVSAPLPPSPARPAPSMNPPQSFTSTDDLLDSLGGPPSTKAPSPSLSLDSDFDLGPPPANSSAGMDDPLDALSGLGGSAAPPPTVDPFGPELSLDSLGPSPSGATGELELDLGLAPAPAGPGDPFGPTLDMEFGSPSPAPASPLEDPFGSALEPGSPFEGGIDMEMPPPPARGAGRRDASADSLSGLGAPGGSSSFTSDPVSVEASVNIPAGSLKADLVEVTVPVDLTMSGGAQDVLIPIRLQLKIRIR
jgi:small GTP-binding protein